MFKSDHIMHKQTATHDWSHGMYAVRCDCGTDRGTYTAYELHQIYNGIKVECDGCIFHSVKA